MYCESCGARPGSGSVFCSQCGAPVARADAAPHGDPLGETLRRELSRSVEIVRLLGRGGMGAVYLGREPALDRDVAIKVLPLERSRSAELRDRFRREARIAARLSHPNIVPLFTFGETDDLVYFVMGFVRGESLGDRLRREGSLAADAARRIVEELADALGYAHENGVIHRDIKPDNVLLDDRSGRAVLADFGIARFRSGGEELTQTGVIIGTPQYMSPEQATGREVDERSDLYSLGVLGYQMVTGRLPIEGRSFAEIVALHARHEPVSITPLDDSIPAPFADAIMRCLRRDPTERWSSASELRRALTNGSLGPAIPEGMSRYDSRGFFLIPFVLLGLTLTLYEIALWDLVEPGWRMLVLLLQILPGLGLLIVANAFMEGRNEGVPPRVTARLLLRAPPRYSGWVPRFMRRPGDIWYRLPAPLRHVRVVVSLGVLYSVPLMAAIPLRVTAAQRADTSELMRPALLAFTVGLTLLMVALIGSIVHANLYLKALGLNAAERSRVIDASTALSTPWSDPRIAEIVLNVPKGRAAVTDPRTPAELARAISSAACDLPPPLGLRLRGVSEALASSLEALGAERARFEAFADRAELDRIDQRIAALEGRDDDESVAMCRVLHDQRQLLADLDSKARKIGEKEQALIGELRGLWSTIRRHGEGDRVAAIENRLDALETIVPTRPPDDGSDEPTLRRG